MIKYQAMIAISLHSGALRICVLSWPYMTWCFHIWQMPQSYIASLMLKTFFPIEMSTTMLKWSHPLSQMMCNLWITVKILILFL